MPEGATARRVDPDKRTAIMNAALELFLERGFHGTAVPLVAERAKVGAGTIYRYFENKEALVNELYREWKQEISQSILHDFPSNAEPREMFAHTWRRITKFVDEHPKVYAFLELHHHAAYLDDESRAVEQRVFDFSKMVIMGGQAKGVIRPGPPEVLLSTLHGAFVGLVRFRRMGRVKWDQASLDCAEQALWDLIAVRSSSP